MPLNESTVEAAALDWLEGRGYTIGHGPQLAPGETATERDSFGDVVLVGRLREAIQRINPTVPNGAREDALRKVLRIATPSLVSTNRLFHALLRDGVPVEYQRKDGSIAGDSVRLIDFRSVDANDWFAVNQFTVVEGCDQPAAGRGRVRERPATRCARAQERRRGRGHDLRRVQGSPDLQGADSVAVPLQRGRRRFRWRRCPDRHHQRRLGTYNAWRTIEPTTFQPAA